MNRSAAIFAVLAGAFALAVAAVSSFARNDGATELSAEAQMLPPDLVDDLKSDPPSRGTFGDRIYCRVHVRPAQTAETVPYCVCYGEAACAELSISGRCDSRPGWFDGRLPRKR